MAAIEAFGLKDRKGRRYFVFVCNYGHWHRGHAQAVKCNAKNRKIDERKARIDAAKKDL